MEKKNKVLILGIGQSNFLDPLYREILKKTDRFKFSITGYTNFSGSSTPEDLPYSDFYDFEHAKISTWNLIKSFFKFSFKSFFWEIIFFELSQKRSFLQIGSILLSFSGEKHKMEKLIVPHNFEIYHLHYCLTRHMKQLFFLPENSKIICSFWGSDLMRITGVSNVYYMKKYLKKATKITLQSPEMAEMFYCKYGREFSEKIEILRFTLDKKIFEALDENRENFEARKLFKYTHGIPDNKFVVALGHNSFSENNQLKMISQLELLPEDIRQSCVFILHLSYGGSPAYIQKLKTLAEGHDLLEIVVIEKFMEVKSISLLRKITDLLIQMPISDALSAAMTEVLYAENIVIAGSWLPYGFLRRNGVFFLESESFQDLPGVFEDAYYNKEKYRKKNHSNPQAIRNCLFPQFTTPQWIQLFNSLN